MLISDPELIKRFLFAGKARFTLVSLRTGQRYTYRISASKDKQVYFVGLMTGSNNDRSFSYIGIIKPEQQNAVRWTRKSKIERTAPAFKAIAWYMQNVGSTAAEFYHDGKCGKYGKSLTVPDSIEIGLGPVCAAEVR